MGDGHVISVGEKVVGWCQDNDGGHVVEQVVRELSGDDAGYALNMAFSVGLLGYCAAHGGRMVQPYAHQDVKPSFNPLEE